MGLPQAFNLFFKKNVISEKCNKAELNNAFYSFKLESVLKTQVRAHCSGITAFSKVVSFDLHFTSLDNYLANWINCLIILMGVLILNLCTSFSLALLLLMICHEFLVWFFFNDIMNSRVLSSSSIYTLHCL